MAEFLEYVLWQLQNGLVLVLLAGVAAAAMIGVTYVLYRRKYKGAKRFPWGRILLGLLFSFGENLSFGFVYAGIACFGLSVVFQLVTLPVEFNASRRAMEAIASGNILTEEEQRGARKTLTAAALTYVAATAVALAQLLRLLVIFGGRRRDD